MGGDGLVELSDAIEVVREQLVTAPLAGQRVVAGRVLTFMVGKVEIEFAGEVKKGGGVKFWVVSADGKAERSSGSTHKVKVELIPHSSDGTSFIVAGGVAEPPSQ